MSLAEVTALTGVSADELREIREVAFERLRNLYPKEDAASVLTRKRAWGE
jgi:hypothetical protein